MYTILISIKWFNCKGKFEIADYTERGWNNAKSLIDIECLASLNSLLFVRI